MDRELIAQTAIAGLLHDIGRFMIWAGVQPSPSTPEQARPAWRKAFLDLFANHPLVTFLSGGGSGSHQPLVEKNQELLRLAGRLSTGSHHPNESSRPVGRSEERLHPIFEHLSISAENTPLPSHRYQPAPLDPLAQNLFPISAEFRQPPPGTPAATPFDHWQAFVAELKSVTADRAEHLVPPLVSLLEKYAWCVPGATERPDVSLYDHSRTTAAIAAALCRLLTKLGHEATPLSAEGEDQTFLLLVGDISGIQDYIFKIKNVGVGGTAKRLRARSFFVSAVTEMAACKCLHAFNMPLTNLIMGAGGKFYLLLPAITKSGEMIAALRREMNDWLLKNLNGELGLNIASVPFACREFREFDTVLRRVNDALRQEKAKPFNGLLSGPAGWCADRFLLRDVAFTSDETLCQACGKFPGTPQGEEGAVMCPHCADDVKLGRRLTKAQEITFHTGTRGRFQVFDDYSFSVHDKPANAAGDVFLIHSLNNWDLHGRHGPVRSRYFANSIPHFDKTLCGPCEMKECREKAQGQAMDGNPKFFPCLAQASRGRKALGVFKADVDNLGLMFINGFGQTSGRSIARIATLSRMLDAFFTGRVDALLRHHFPDLYTVYAGGDDLLLLGPWNQVLEFGRRLREEFRDYTCGNPDFTLSAGMALAKPRLPLYAVVQSAEELLESAKREVSPGATRPKDQFATLDDRFKWDEAGRLHDEAEQLASWLAAGTGRLTMATVRQLLESADQFRRFKKNGDTRALRFVPMLAYTINRNIDSRCQEVVKWLHALTNLGNKNLRHLAFIANYAIISNRS